MPLLIAACAVAVSLPGVLTHALYGDEVASARIVTEDGPADALGRVRRTESTPPGWYLLAWGAGHAFGGEPARDVSSLRLLSVLFAAGAAALTATWARRLVRRSSSAALAGLLVALGSVPAAYAEQLRAYALLVLLSVGFGFVIVQTALRPRRLGFVGAAALAWAGAMTHYFFLFVAAAGAAWLWTARPRLAAAGRVTIAIGVGLLAFLPWLPVLLEQRAHGRFRWIGAFDAIEVVKVSGSLFFGPDGLLYGLARLAATLALVAGAIALGRRTEGGAVVALGLLPIAGAGVLWAVGQPIFDDRNLLLVAPFLAISIAAGVDALPARLALPGVALAAAIVLVAAGYEQAKLGRVAYDSVGRTLRDLGWTRREPFVVAYGGARSGQRNAAIQITSALAWYLPGHPMLAWTRVRSGCRTRFALVQVPEPRVWLAAYRGRVTASRDFAYYDHPILGRARGRIVVARFRRPTHVPGAVFYVAGREAPCHGRVAPPKPVRRV